MSTIDLSREATDFRKHYNSIRMQQGRVLDDQTVNEQARIIEEDARRTRINSIGVYGTPGEGFLPRDLSLSSGKPTFSINKGEMYLGGLYLTLDEDEAFHLQKDWINFHPEDDWPEAPAEGGRRIDMVYVEAWQQPVSAIEDNELFEVALGGPDTSVRVKTMKRLRIETDVGSDECTEAWQNVQGNWTAQGVINEEMELATDAKIQVSYTAPTEPADLCSPAMAGGYLHYENQAIRVQLTSATHFTWGFDNAAPLYRARVTTSDGDRIRIELLNEPKDAVHWPLQDQVVEIIPWSAVLPNGERTAELSGMFARVSSSYNPDDATFLIDTPVPLDFGTQWESRDDVADFFDGSADERFYYVRVWNRGDDLGSPAEIPITDGRLGNTGLEVTFVDGPLREDLYWIIAARPASPNVVVPWVLESVNGAPPHGVKIYRAPVALVGWSTTGGVTEGELLHDCRVPYHPLTRIRNCCTYTVGDGTHSYGHFNSIQEAINQLPPAGGKICVLAGEYEENLVIARDNVIIEGCGSRSRLQAATSDSAIMIEDASQVHIRDLEVRAHQEGRAIYVRRVQQLPVELAFTRLLLNGATLPALQIDAGRFIDVRDNRVVMQDVPGDFHGMFITADDVTVEHNELLVVPGNIKTVDNSTTFNGASARVQAARGGLHIGGTSERVRVIDNLIQGGIGNGVTLGSVEDINADTGDARGVMGWIVDLGDPCDPCKPGSVYIPPGVEDGDGRVYRSTGTIYELTIHANRIFDFGLNGIGVLAFFSLEGTDEFISVDGIDIAGNHIERCLFRDLADTPDEMLESMGYGGISLADVENAVIRENDIVDNGPDHLDPVCGIYVLHAEGIDISNNRIVNNGARTDQSPDDAKRGARAGVWIEFATAPKVIIETREQFYPRQNGVPAAKVHNNVVSQPLGRSLSITALGPVSVEGNQLTSRAFVARSDAAAMMVSNVQIFNLGISNELYLQQILFSGEDVDDVPVAAPSDPDYFIISQPGLDTRRMFGYLGNGNVLFSDNQVMLDLTEQTGFKMGIMSIGIFSLDDVNFQANQCDISYDFVLDEIYLTQAMMFGWTLRASGNRFKESLVGALFSAITFSLFGNITAHNQGTHCIRASNFSGGNLTRSPNHVLFDLFGVCDERNDFLVQDQNSFNQQSTPVLSLL